MKYSRLLDVVHLSRMMAAARVFEDKVLLNCGVIGFMSYFQFRSAPRSSLSVLYTVMNLKGIEECSLETKDCRLKFLIFF